MLRRIHGIRDVKPFGESAHPPQCRGSTHVIPGFILGSRESIPKRKEIIPLQVGEGRTN